MRRMLRPFAPFLGAMLLVGGVWAVLRSNWSGLMVIVLILLAIGVQIGDAIFYANSSRAREMEDAKEELPKEKTEGEDAQSP